MNHRGTWDVTTNGFGKLPEAVLLSLQTSHVQRPTDLHGNLHTTPELSPPEGYQ